MDEINQFFSVVLVGKDGRMQPCQHQHLTREAADDCVKVNGGISIIEWVKDRRPQFEQVWVHPELEKEQSNG